MKLRSQPTGVVLLALGKRGASPECVDKLAQALPEG